MSVHAVTALAFGSKEKLRNPIRCGHIRCRGEAHWAQEDRTVCQTAESLCLAAATDTGIGLRQRTFIELTKPTDRPAPEA